MDDTETQRQKRRGYWLRIARERAEFTLSAAAEAANLKPGSGSTVSLWESGARAVKMVHLERLARAYRVPVRVFTHPEPTDEERLDTAILSATDAERADWEGEPAADRANGAEPAVSLRKQSA